jgi:phosphatidylserine decarboxylase
MGIQVWNRRNASLEEEQVYGDFFVRLLYGNPIGFALADSLLVKKFVSGFYGNLQSGARSAKKVVPFVEKFGLLMEQYEPGPYSSFNDFFIRKFRPGQRKFPEASGQMGAPAEARYLAWADSSEPISVPVKGLSLGPMELLGSTPEKEKFKGGPCLLARLCPVDYHRYHYPDAGKTVHHHVETGKLHSVNPLALRRHPRLLLTNERQISILKTEAFGLLAYVEVGALCVGRIVQSHPIERPFARGQEKGYFLFGGSTVVVYGEKGAWQPAADLMENTRQGIETLVELGSPVGEKGNA